MMHKSVLLNESICGLNIKEDGVYVDATLGYGGHSSEILKKINKGYLYAIDQDKDAINYSYDILKKIGSNFEIINNNFVNMKEELARRGVFKVDGIMFDLGVSSPQLDTKERGFSYHEDYKLDMRMNQDQKLSAYQVVNQYSEQDLVRIFREYGEEKYASSIARNIVKARSERPIETTLELVDIIKNSVPFKAKRDGHPAKRVFQAIRIEVNNELEVLKSALEDALSLLKVGGRICVITFHSLEDRIVKHTFATCSDVSSSMKDLPFIPDEYLPRYKIVSKKIEPSEAEIKENKRSRSARLRIIERIRE